MKLYFYKRTRYPADEQPNYYNLSKGIAGFAKKQDGVCLFEGTVEEFEEYTDATTSASHQRRYHRTNRLPLN